MSQFFTSGSQSIGASTSAISSSNKYSGLISFMDGLVRSPCSPRDSQESSPTPQYINYQHQHHRVSILWHSTFFMLQLSHPYMATGKTIALTRHTFVGKVMSLLLNMLSRLVITFPRSKCLLISWLQSPSAGPLKASLGFESQLAALGHWRFCPPIQLWGLCC